MTTRLADDDGHVTDALLAYYRARTAAPAGWTDDRRDGLPQNRPADTVSASLASSTAGTCSGCLAKFRGEILWGVWRR